MAVFLNGGKTNQTNVVFPFLFPFTFKVLALHSLLMRALSRGVEF